MTTRGLLYLGSVADTAGGDRQRDGITMCAFDEQYWMTLSGLDTFARRETRSFQIGTSDTLLLRVFLSLQKVCV